MRFEVARRFRSTHPLLPVPQVVLRLFVIPVAKQT